MAGVGLLAGCGIPFGSPAQPARLHRIGYLSMGTLKSSAPSLEAFGHGLRELGYVEGRTYAIEARYGEGREERYPELAAELVRLEVDVIVNLRTAQALGLMMPQSVLAQATEVIQ